MVSQDWQIPVKTPRCSLPFLHTVQVAAFLKAAAALPKVYLEGDPGDHALLANSYSVPWMSWSPDMFACGVGILLFESVKTPF